MLLKDRRALVTGVANQFSIAWAIARAFHREGGRIALTYQNERVKDSVEKLAQTLSGSMTVACDVSSDAEVDAAAKAVGEKFGGIDILVHSIAYAAREELSGEFVKISREGYRLAQEISAYSFIALARACVPWMKSGGSIMTLTYLGGWRVVPNYNVMALAKASLDTAVRYLASEIGPKNIRVNGISAGPIKTAAARGIKDFNKILENYRTKTPLRRNVEAEEVADTAVFLASDLSRGITGEILYVDAGYHVMGT